MADRPATITERGMQITIGPLTLSGDLSLPPQARGLVLFAHGSGSSRYSPRNRSVARLLQQGGFATLLMDLLTPDEERVDARTAHLRFDIDLLAARLVGATDWVRQRPEANALRLGYFGASTGGGAALVAAAERPDQIKAVVSRGGRPDLAGQALSRVQAPTLLVVGGEDQPVLVLNRKALEQLPGEKDLAIIPHATHLFEEAGALEQVAHLAQNWFARHLVEPG